MATLAWKVKIKLSLSQSCFGSLSFGVVSSSKACPQRPYYSRPHSKWRPACISFHERHFDASSQQNTSKPNAHLLSSSLMRKFSYERVFGCFPLDLTVQVAAESKAQSCPVGLNMALPSFLPQAQHWTTTAVHSLRQTWHSRCTHLARDHNRTAIYREREIETDKEPGRAR